PSGLRCMKTPAIPTTMRPSAAARASVSGMSLFLESHAATAAAAGGALGDELDPGGVERSHQLHQRIDVAANGAVARLHALDRRQRKPARFRQRLLIHAEQGTRRFELGRRDHTESIRVDVSALSFLL